MEALDRAGRRWDALDVYERLCRVLEEEYAAAPEPATRSLYRRILSGQSSAGPAVTCDNLLSAEMVTAEGELVRASEDQNADLFWALRGGGGNFGVVTELELALHPVGPAVLGGAVFYPGQHAAQVLAGWRDAVAGAPDELTTLVDLTTAPAAPFLPEDLHGKKVVILSVCWAGPPGEGEEVVRPLRALGTPLVDLLGPIPYVALQQLVDPLYAAGAANYFTSAFLDELPDPAVETFADAHRRSAGLPATCELHVHQLGGAMARTAPGARRPARRRSASGSRRISSTASRAHPRRRVSSQPRVGPRYAGLDGQVRGTPDACQLHRRGGRGQGTRVLPGGDLREASRR